MADRNNRGGSASLDRFCLFISDAWRLAERALSQRILFVTDGGSGLLKALRAGLARN